MLTNPASASIPSHTTTSTPGLRADKNMTTAAATRLRVAIVTGAAQGIGRSIALRLAQDGLCVAVNDIPAKSANIDEVVGEIKAVGALAVSAPADVTDEDAVQKMVESVVDKLGALDVVSGFACCPVDTAVESVA